MRFFLIFCCLSFFVPLFAANANQDLLEIDAKIKELTEMKRGYEAKALRHENQAERLQFEDRALLETRRHLQLADENRQKAARIQEEIDKLKAQREIILRKNGTSAELTGI
jgi:hypothetical protein